MTLGLIRLFFIGFALAGVVLLPEQNADQTSNPEVMQAVKAAFPAQIRFTGKPPSGERDPANPDTCAVVFSRNAEGIPGLVFATYSDKASKSRCSRTSRARCTLSVPSQIVTSFSTEIIALRRLSTWQVLRMPLRY
jgi:hypothetical protein